MSDLKLKHTWEQINDGIDTGIFLKNNKASLAKYGERDGRPTFNGMLIGEKPFNWRGVFQIGNMYNINDVVIGSDGNDYIAVMDGIVLAPPSMGWDLFLQGGGALGIEEAPQNGNIYARVNGAWIDITDRLLPL